MITPILISVVLFLLGIILPYYFLPKILDFVIEKSQHRGFYNGPWKTHLGVGRKKTTKIEKAAIARVGLGGNSSDETIYWNVFTDSSGEPLNTKNKYKIIVNSEIPINYKNHGFWSITVYGEDKFLMKNDAKKYMVRHTDFMDHNYPLNILISKKNEFKNDEFIPLTKKDQKFSMALRCYRPLNSMKNEKECLEIELPKIIRLK